jgi:hypothetical protein
MLKQDLAAKAVAQDRQSHQKAKELAILRKAIDTAQRRVLLLEVETQRQKQVIQVLVDMMAPVIIFRFWLACSSCGYIQVLIGMMAPVIILRYWLA